MLAAGAAAAAAVAAAAAEQASHGPTKLMLRSPKPSTKGVKGFWATCAALPLHCKALRLIPSLMLPVAVEAPEPRGSTPTPEEDGKRTPEEYEKGAIAWWLSSMDSNTALPAGALSEAGAAMLLLPNIPAKLLKAGWELLEAVYLLLL
jgi:hypothetical protein